MNKLERQMLEILDYGRIHLGYLGVKAEFEAEGTRVDELFRLSDITRRARLNLGLKIGGCEALRDLMDCKQFGADYIIAPMVESSYALTKYLQIKNRLYSPFEQEHVRFLFNVETTEAFSRIDELLETASARNGAHGVVFGRGDYTLSCGMPRDSVNCEKIKEDCITVARRCRDHKLDFVVGGSVMPESIPTLRQIHDVYLSRLETRKIIIDGKALASNRLEESLTKALEFELLWLQNKREYYLDIADEDLARIERLSKRGMQENTSTVPSAQTPAMA